jgi:hypothetical protein
VSEEQVVHCKDCCCARSWKALGITEYTGLSIPEHILRLREALERIAAGDGYYGAQAREYKQIAQSALARKS